MSCNQSVSSDVGDKANSYSDEQKVGKLVDSYEEEEYSSFATTDTSSNDTYSQTAKSNEIDSSSIPEDLETHTDVSSEQGELLALPHDDKGGSETSEVQDGERKTTSFEDAGLLAADIRQKGEENGRNEGKADTMLTGSNRADKLTSDKSETANRTVNYLEETENTTKKQSNTATESTTNFKTVAADKLSESASEFKLDPIENLQKVDGYLEDATMPSVEAVHCPKAIMRDLAEPVFDVWRLDRDSMVEHIEYMYHDLGIVRAWKIPRTTLKMFILGVREKYQDNPYHNFKHCFCVAQMTYSMLCKLRLRGLISVDHMGALLTAAVCHDVDHPGLNNSYHCHARTPLAILYNYQSILEQHHFAVTCRILSNKERNIVRNVMNRDEVLANIRELILATDLARHKTIIEDYRRSINAGFDFKNSEHVMALLKVIIKCADVSNEVRPETVSGPWVERLFAEYYEQSAREKRECLPVTPYMDPDLVNVSESQEGFIRGIMLPMYDELSKLMIDARVYYVNPLYETLMKYEIQNVRAHDI